MTDTMTALHELSRLAEDTSRTHVYTIAGCVNQWRSDHDDQHCIETFRGTEESAR